MIEGTIKKVALRKRTSELGFEDLIEVGLVKKAFQGERNAEAMKAVTMKYVLEILSSLSLKYGGGEQDRK